MDRLRIREGARQSPAADAHLAQDQGGRHRFIGGFVHPSGALRSYPAHHVITRAEAVAAAEISRAALVLSHHDVHAEQREEGNHEVTRIVAV
ncbi:MAG: hypothetical protein ACREYC_22350, partial [Gammaproteobacteria bacterium]